MSEEIIKNKKIFRVILFLLFTLIIVGISAYLLIFTLYNHRDKSSKSESPQCKLSSDYLLPLTLTTVLNNNLADISNVVDVNKKNYTLGTFLLKNITGKAVVYYDPVAQTLTIIKPLGITDPFILIPPNINPTTGSSITINALVCESSTGDCDISNGIIYTYKGTVWPSVPYDPTKKSGTFVLNTFDATQSNPVTTLSLISITNCK